MGIVIQGGINMDGGIIITRGGAAPPPPPPSEEMVLVFNVVDENEPVYVPLGGSVDASIDWGDGNSNIALESGTYDHSYETTGLKTVTVTGSAESFGGFNPQLIEVNSWGNLGLTSLSQAFSSAANVNSVAAIPTTVTDLSYMFDSSGTEAFNANISGWDTGNVTNMYAMFQYSPIFNGNINSWNVSNVQYIDYMFYGASSFNQNLDSWNTSNVGDETGAGMLEVFAYATSFNGNISTWDTSGVYDMERLFEGATSFNGNIASWDTGNVVNMALMFFDATSFNQYIGGWNTSNVEVMDSMFQNAVVFNQDLSGWDVGNVVSYVDFDTGANAWILSKPNFI